MLVGRRRPARRWSAATGLRDACRRASISPPVGFHALRHSWASLAVMAGMPLMVVARNLGHASTVMVEKHYGHLSTSYIDHAIRAVIKHRQFSQACQCNLKSIDKIAHGKLMLGA